LQVNARVFVRDRQTVTYSLRGLLLVKCSAQKRLFFLDISEMPGVTDWK